MVIRGKLTAILRLHSFIKLFDHIVYKLIKININNCPVFDIEVISAFMLVSPFEKGSLLNDRKIMIGRGYFSEECKQKWKWQIDKSTSAVSSLSPAKRQYRSTYGNHSHSRYLRLNPLTLIDIYGVLFSATHSFQFEFRVWIILRIKYRLIIFFYLKLLFNGIRRTLRESITISKI